MKNNTESVGCDYKKLQRGKYEKNMKMWGCDYNDQLQHFYKDIITNFHFRIGVPLCGCQYHSVFGTC
jgi:hypothetical protein